MADALEPIIQVDPQLLKNRFEMIVTLFQREFLAGIDAKYREQIYLNKELLHCAVKAYFDDIERYKAYAGSEYADCHKQAAYTIKWINRFKPIQIKENAEMDSTLLTINATFALAVGFGFLDKSVAEKIGEHFFRHLVYTLTYRSITGKNLATIMYTLECATKGEAIL